MLQIHGIFLLGVLSVAISGYASYRNMPWGLQQQPTPEKQVLNRGRSVDTRIDSEWFEQSTTLESDVSETWKRAIQPVIGSPPTPLSRLDLYRSAWLGYKDVVTFQITSDRRVYVAPPARPKAVENMFPWEREYFHGRILASLLMMQLALRHMVQEDMQIPNVTLVNKYVDDCFRDFSVNSIIDWADYKAMNDSCHPAWDQWLGTNSKSWRQNLAMNTSELPTAGFAPILFWHTSQTGMDSAADCHGLSMPNYDWVFTDIVLDDTGLLENNKSSVNEEEEEFAVIWKSRKSKLIWRGGFHGEARPLPPEFLGDRNLVPRARAARASLQMSEFIDVKLVGNPDEYKLDPRLYGDTVSYQEQLTEYNYALNIDGYGPSSRLRTQLAAGVLVFKVDSVMKAHYMEGMVPWVHYIPVSWGDLENDLVRKVKWARTHDEAARKIAFQGQRYARQYLSDTSTAQYMVQVIQAFADAEEPLEQPFELIPGSIPFCCQHLEAYNLTEYKPEQGIDTKEYFIQLCRNFTAGWAPPCDADAHTNSNFKMNPADAAFAI